MKITFDTLTKENSKSVNAFHCHKILGLNCCAEYTYSENEKQVFLVDDEKLACIDARDSRHIISFVTNETLEKIMANYKILKTYKGMFYAFAPGKIMQVFYDPCHSRFSEMFRSSMPVCDEPVIVVVTNFIDKRNTFFIPLNDIEEFEDKTPLKLFTEITRPVIDSFEFYTKSVRIPENLQHINMAFNKSSTLIDTEGICVARNSDGFSFFKKQGAALYLYSLQKESIPKFTSEDMRIVLGDF